MRTLHGISSSSSVGWTVFPSSPAVQGGPAAPTPPPTDSSMVCGSARPGGDKEHLTSEIEV